MRFVYFYLIVFVSLILTLFITAYGTQEARSTVHQWKWNGKGWTITNASSIPRSISNPYGFLLGDVAHGRSFTMVVPYNRFGFQREARIHWWK